MATGSCALCRTRTCCERGLLRGQPDRLGIAQLPVYRRRVSKKAAQRAVTVELNLESLPHVLRDLVLTWLELVNEEWSTGRTLPARTLVDLQRIVHATAVATYLEDGEFIGRLRAMADKYFNDAETAANWRPDEVWFRSRPRAVGELVELIKHRLRIAEQHGPINFDDPEALTELAGELTSIVAECAARHADVMLEILVDLPSDFDSAPRLELAREKAHRSLVTAIGSGKPVSPVAVLEGILAALGYPTVDSLLSNYRKGAKR